LELNAAHLLLSFQIMKRAIRLPICLRQARFPGWLPLLLAQFALLLSLQAQQVPVTEHTLSNGMKVLLLERHDDPSVSGGWVAHVGSANERPGITGIAHLFEHMMFKGTPTIGTKDAKRDSEIIQEQERVRDLMRQEEAKMRAAYRRGDLDDLTKPENKSEHYKELEKEFTTLVEAQRELQVKNEFDRIYRSAGGAGMNAFTMQDMTGYFINVPANKMELWMWMESERLLHPVFREFYAERDVVYEERRMRTESTPLGKFEETFNAMFWDAHPYHWPVIGWPSDLPSISKSEADDFYATYYSPQNLTLILVGDFDSQKLLPQLERYFGRIPRGAQTPPDIVTQEVPQIAEKRMYAEAEANPQVEIRWHTVPFAHHDAYALDILGELLSGRTGRLYKGLVLGSEVATQAGAGQQSYKWAGYFSAEGTELEKLQREEVHEEELQKVKDNFAAAEYRKLGSKHAILLQLIFNEGLGDWREVNNAAAKYQAVTAEDIKRVAEQYFTKENRAVAIYTRKPTVADAK